MGRNAYYMFVFAKNKEWGEFPTLSNNANDPIAISHIINIPL